MDEKEERLYRVRILHKYCGRLDEATVSHSNLKALLDNWSLGKKATFVNLQEDGLTVHLNTEDVHLSYQSI